MAYLLLVFPVFSGNTIPLGIQLLGIVLGIWAILVMSKSKLNITPVPRNGSSLVIFGPYRFVRHPMYLSLLLFLTPIIIYHHTSPGIIVFGIFLGNLILKLSYEEQLLLQTFHSYKEYQLHTWRLIPWVY
jgi:protein-S-isoprenylcysteine O-methyltransferase Ste14